MPSKRVVRKPPVKKTVSIGAVGDVVEVSITGHFKDELNREMWLKFGLTHKLTGDDTLDSAADAIEDWAVDRVSTLIDKINSA